METPKDKTPVPLKTAAPPAPIPPAGPEVATPEVETSYILTKDVSLPINRQLVTLRRGDVVDDQNLIAKIREACSPAPLRPLNVLDLVDRN